MKKNKCRVCLKKIKAIMSFGRMPIANAFVLKKNLKKQYFYELKIGFCKSCFTFQVIKVPNAKKMFNNKYAYLASTSKVMSNHWKNFSEYVVKRFNLKKNSFVVEVGSNDGIFLQNIAKKKMKHLGIDASVNVCKIANKKGVNTLNAFFNLKTSKKISNTNGSADLIISTNTMHHIEDINEVAEGMANLLSNKGVVITEDPSLVEMINKNSYDQIYAEHMYIWSLSSINSLFGKYDLEVFDIENNSFHGGCSRYFISKKNTRNISQRVKQHEKIENKIGIKKTSTYLNFVKKIKNSKRKLNELLIKLKKQGKTIVGYGAPAKSTTVLNYCNLNNNIIDKIFDNSKTKINKYTPGKSNIKIVNSNKFKNYKSDYCVLFAWNHKKEILSKEKNYKKNGGNWILPIFKIGIV